MHYIKPEELFNNIANNKNTDLQIKTYKWIGNNYTMLELLVFIPINTFISWIVFRKWGYNFVEMAIVNSFLSAQRLAMSILFYPIIIFVGNAKINTITQIVSFTLSAALIIWTYFTLFRNKSKKSVILKLILNFVLFIIAMIIVMIILTIFLMLFYKKVENINF